MIDILLIIIGISLLLIGLAGCVLPIIPGPPISYLALLILHFSPNYQFSTDFLILWAVIAIGVTIVDNFIPMYTTKKFGGSKRAIWGSIVGLVAGIFFFPPIGLIVGPFVGAVLGELSAGKDTQTALRSGFGAFMGFVGGTLLKLVASGMMIFYFVRELI
jgi:uncharacterized protein